MNSKGVFRILGIVSSLAVFASIGLGGNGVWPLNLRGDATQEGGLLLKPLDVTFGAISDTELIGTAGFKCRTGNTAAKRFIANGQLKLGEELFTVVGVCERQDSSLVEIVAQSRVGGVIKNVNVTGNRQINNEVTVIAGSAYVSTQGTMVYSINLEGETPAQ